MNIKSKFIADMIGCSNQTLLKYVKKFYIEVVRKGRPTILNYERIGVIITTMKKTRKNQYSKLWDFETIENMLFQNEVGLLRTEQAA
jgi:predicted site-specific integrase-resolvase